MARREGVGREAGAVRQSLMVLGYVVGHPANRGHRLRALLRAVRFQVRGRLLGRPSTARVGDSMRLTVPLHASGASKAVYANPPDYAEMMAWRRVLGAGDLFLDVGSNAGLYSVWAADCGASPIAVEPDQLSVARTRDNLRLNAIRGEVHQVALADRPGTMLLTRGDDAVNHLLTEASGQERSEAQVVEVRTLSDVLGDRRCRGAKIDVEGYERLVLEGARQVLAREGIDVVQLEWNSLSHAHLGESREPVHALLTEYGYVLCRPDADFRLRPMTHVPSSSDDDVFAVSASYANAHRGDLGWSTPAPPS